jgi:GNAT superfamily N-acetyltransferase
MPEIREMGGEKILDLYTGCIPPGAEEAGRESGEHFLGKRAKGWRGFVAYEDDRPVGRVEVRPLEESFAAFEGESLYFMPCINILPEAQKKGYGKALMERVFEVTGDRKGLVTWTVDDWMPKEFLEKMGFEVVQEMGPAYLLLKKHREDAQASWLSPAFTPRHEPDKVNVEVVMNYECPFMIANYRKLMAKAKELSGRVEVTEYLLKERRDIKEYGDMNFYIDGEAPFFGPGKEEDLERIIREHLERKGLA